MENRGLLETERVKFRFETATLCNFAAEPPGGVAENSSTMSLGGIKSPWWHTCCAVSMNSPQAADNLARGAVWRLPGVQAIP